MYAQVLKFTSIEIYNLIGVLYLQSILVSLSSIYIYMYIYLHSTTWVYDWLL